jgi:predicted DNA-binding transcriptional regulator AlpA
MSTETRLLRTREVRARYGGICNKTIDRWLERGTLPQPVRVNGNRYWYEHDLEKLERASMAARPNSSVTETELETPA